MAERWARLRFGSPGLFTLLTASIGAGVVWVSWVVGYFSFELRHVFFAAFSGLCFAAASAFGRSQAPPPFPPGLHLDDTMRIWRLVRYGGPVENKADVSAVNHHARWLLSGPSTSALATGLAVAISVAAVVIIVAPKDDPFYVRVPALYLVVFAAMIPMTMRRAKWLWNAERVLEVPKR
ncbi:hypothetical protein [Kibdelosporangium aridum]|uniref:Uncharacterized protein n=1 Tax=Kibdelosporangium aridum TaxID=2030 RepID=A0A1W2AAY7_KIBAR|nr:hypothetical protein [Kibdelosporangium aridum]SMC57753.1 hypothetical protein SAMN05661093_00627 [Kibdelosporangium aridum]